MRVYDRRPSGMAPGELAAQARRDRGGAVFAVVRGIVGIVMMGLLAAPLGELWFVVGLGLLASVFLFVRDAGRGALERPAFVLTGRPKWDGVRRVAWQIDADDVLQLGRRLADRLDATYPGALTAFDLPDTYRGATRNEIFDAAAEAPGLIAWGVDGKARLAAAEAVVGVWLRVDRPEDGPPTITVLANEGAAVAAVRSAALSV